MSFVVYTSLYGNYDRPKPPRPHSSVSEWRLYTDNDNTYAPGWNVVVEQRPEEQNARMRAKFRKCHPPSDSESSLYLDASIRLHDPNLIEHAVRLVGGGAVWCMYPHPERSRLRDELEASISSTWKYRECSEKMTEQVAFYEASEPPVERLWAGGIVVRKHTSAVMHAGAAWWQECVRWTYQDQLSIPIVLARHGIDVTPLTVGGGLWRNMYFTVESNGSVR